MRKDKIAGLVLGGRKVLRNGLLVALVGLWPALTHAETAVQAWIQRWGGPYYGDDCARAVAVDSAGNVIVTGAHGKRQQVPGLPQFYDDFSGFATIKYSSDGVPVWTNLSGYLGHGLFNGGYAVAVDGHDDIIVTEFLFASVSTPTAKYSSAGDLLWRSPFHTSQNRMRAVVVDAQDNVIVTGGAGYTNGYITEKYSAAGVPLWTSIYPAGANLKAEAVALDSDGDVVVTGISAAVKYSSTGEVLWAKKGGSDVVVDSQGNVIVTGRWGTVPRTAYETIKYSGAGVALWTNYYQGAWRSNDFPNALALDSKGNVFVTGASYVSNACQAYATIAYSAEGAPLWTNFFKAYAGGREEGWTIAVDRLGSVLVMGCWVDRSASRTLSSYWSVIKYSNAGIPLWTNRLQGTGQVPGRRCLAIGPDGAVYTTHSSWDFVTSKLVSTPQFLAQLDDRTNNAGTIATFTVTPYGGGPFACQWLKDRAGLSDADNISGTTTATLTLSNVQNADEGRYSVLVTNRAGAAESAAALLVVITPDEAVEALVLQVVSSWSRPKPLLATLLAALDSLERGNNISAVNQLQAFQNQVHAQVARSDSALAASFSDAAQSIINSIHSNQPREGSHENNN